jgi:hypothetical protein
VINAFLNVENENVSIEAYTAKQLMYKNLFYEYVRERIPKPTKVIIPDFVIILKACGDVQAYLGEVDTQTESLQVTSSYNLDIETKFKTVEAYRNFGITNFFNDQLDDFEYLHITTGNIKRISQILSIANTDVFVAQHNDISPIVTEKETSRPKIEYSPIFKPVWYRTGNDISTRSTIA